MLKEKSINPTTRELAKKLLTEGLSIRSVAEQTKISKSTVGVLRTEIKKKMTINKGGRPKALGKKHVEFLKVQVKQGKIKDAVQGAKEINMVLSKPVCAQTIRRALKKDGSKVKK